jgi:hypothetical protein
MFVRNGPLWQLRLCAMGHCSEFGFTVVIFVMQANPQNEAEQ